MRRIAYVLVPLFLLACDQAPTASEAALLAIQNTPTGEPQTDPSSVFPSTNEINYNMTPTRWAHVLWVEDADDGPEQVTLRFVSERSFASCFEYRLDDEPPTSTANGGNNYNTLITDGMWNFTCQGNSSEEITFTARSYVDVRSGFGAESDERFDWTRFYVSPILKDDCKSYGWVDLGFRNQGQCVRFVETGKDDRIGE